MTAAAVAKVGRRAAGGAVPKPVPSSSTLSPAAVKARKSSTPAAAPASPPKTPPATPPASPASSAAPTPEPAPASSSTPKSGGSGGSASSALDQLSKIGTVPQPVATGAGFVLGVLFWCWVGLPFLKGGPAGVKNVIRAKFLNRGPDGTWLP